MRRIASTLALTSGIAVAGLLFAPAANADVTNPADNPSPITVTGDDGLTYTDGRDTLPGYDDEACTYIPGAYFDFENNKVHYADGQSIPWTEWSRATGYQAWLAKKPAAAAPAPAPAAPAAGSKPSAATAPEGVVAKTTGSTAVGSAVVGAASPSDAATATSSPDASRESSSQASTAATGQVATAGHAEVLAAGAGQAGSGSVGSSAGLAILGGLFGLGGLAFGGYAFFRRGGQGKSA